MHPSLSQSKRRGEWVEMLFATKATALGFNATRPWGDSLRYDVILEKSGRFLRVQVKSTCILTTHNKSAYQCKLARHGKTHFYHPGNVDVMVFYIVPEDVWYIMPVQVIGHNKYFITFSPNGKDKKYQAYKEAWHLLDQFITDAGGLYVIDRPTQL